MRKSVRSLVVAGTAAAALVVGSGLAYGYVATQGHGEAQQSTVSKTKYTLKVDVSNVSELTPGNTEDVVVTVTNTGPAKVRISGVVLSLPASVAGVTPSALGTVHLTQPSVTATVLDKGASKSFTGTVSIDDSASVDQISLLDKDITVSADVS